MPGLGLQIANDGFLFSDFTYYFYNFSPKKFRKEP